MNKNEFRAFDPRINKMYPFVILGWNGAIESRLIDDDHTSMADIRFNHTNGKFEDYPDDVIIISRKIFIEDKNNKTAYQGDIIRENGKGKIGKIQWNAEKLRFEIFFGYGDIWGIDKHWFKSCEILGNIWQNSELLS